MKKLAIVTSHPIQYNAPLFALLNKCGKVIPKVFYTWHQSQAGLKYDPGFKKTIQWDLPLLEGYDFTFVRNISKDPGTHHFKGLVNPSLNEEIAAWEPDAVLVFGWSFTSHLKCIRHFHNKIPVLFRGDSTLLDEAKGVKTFLRRLFLKWVYAHVNLALYVGTNNKAYFLKHGLKEHQLKYAPHAIDNDRFSDSGEIYQQQAVQLREKLGINRDDIVLLFAGKFEPKKNPFFLVQLLKRHNNPRLKVLFVGNGLLENILKNEAVLDDRIMFIDFQNQQQMPVIYRVGDVFLMPSIGPGETWGLALNEAMACGKPLIASDKAGGAIDLIEDQKNGIMMSFNTLDPVDVFLERILGDEYLLHKMGNRSKEIIKQFNYLNTVDQIGAIMAAIK